MATTLLLQTRTRTDADDEVRAAQKVGVFDADPARLLEAVAAVLPRFGAVSAIPAIAHEANMKRLLQRDLAEAGLHEVTAEAEGAVRIEISRAPKVLETGETTSEVFDVTYAAERA